MSEPLYARSASYDGALRQVLCMRAYGVKELRKMIERFVAVGLNARHVHGFRQD